MGAPPSGSYSVSGTVYDKVHLNESRCDERSMIPRMALRGDISSRVNEALLGGLMKCGHATHKI